MTPTLNARGGINKTSNREKAGLTTAGSAGVNGAEKLAEKIPSPTTTTTPINRTTLDSLKTAPTIIDIPTPLNTDSFSDIITRFTPQVNAPSGTQTLQNTLQNQTARTNELETEAGLADMNSRSGQLRTQIADLTASFGTSIQNQEGFVRPQEFITGRQAYLQNQKAVQIEGLAAAQAAIDGNIALANQRIERAVEREFGTVEQQLQAAQLDYQQNKDAYDRIDATRGEMLAERARVLQSKKDEKSEVLKLMVTVAERGGDPSTLAQMAKSNMEDAISLASPYLPVPEKPDIREVGNSLVRINPDGTTSVIFGQNNTGANPGQVLSQGGTIYDAMAASQYRPDGEFNTNFVTGSQLETLEQLNNTVSQFSNLQDALERDDGRYVPFLSEMRKLNPYDTSAQEVQARLNSIVSNIARGIYNEVGVLTDPDVERYLKTLPTLSTTQDVQDAVSLVTLSVMKDAAEAKMKLYATNGYNVSGNSYLLEQMEQKIGQTALPIYQRTDTYKNLVESGIDQNKLNEAITNGNSLDEIVEFLNEPPKPENEVSFGNAISAAADAIAAVESRGSGDYSAIGPLVTKGPYAGEKALGRYQVMPGNLPEWSKGALGRVVSPQEFLARPDIQDAIFAWQFGNLAKQHGTLEDAASAWYTGRPMAVAIRDNAKDVTGTTVPQYIRKFRENLNLQNYG